MKKLLKSIKNLPGEGNIWGLAIRKRHASTLYQGDFSSFRFIKNSLKYWRADPFLFDYKDKTFVFAELFDRISGKGVIGVAKITNGRCSRFKVCLKLPYHLSYPCVFERNNEIFLVPECAKSEKVTVYRSVDFPYKWEKAYTLYEGAAVDTTPIPSVLSKQMMFFTTLKDNVHPLNSCLYAISDNKDATLLLENDFTVRSAGHIIVEENRVIRPAQDCTLYYGQGLLFKEISFSDLTKDYQEKTYRNISVDDLRINNTKLRFTGVHTYNLSNHYEIVDLSYSVGKSIPYIIKKIIRHFK